MLHSHIAWVSMLHSHTASVSMLHSHIALVSMLHSHIAWVSMLHGHIAWVSKLRSRHVLQSNRVSQYPTKSTWVSTLQSPHASHYASHITCSSMLHVHITSVSSWYGAESCQHLVWCCGQYNLAWSCSTTQKATQTTGVQCNMPQRIHISKLPIAIHNNICNCSGEIHNYKLITFNNCRCGNGQCSNSKRQF